MWRPDRRGDPGATRVVTEAPSLGMPSHVRGTISTMLHAIDGLTAPLKLDPQNSEELVHVDRLRYVIGGARLQTLLAVALHRLRGDRDYRQGPERVVATDLAHGLVAVHPRHHNVDQHRVDFGIGLEEFDAVTPVLREQDLQPVLLQRTGEREDVAQVVVDEEDSAALK